MKATAALRFSLLVSIGISVACGGVVHNDPEGAAGSGGSGDSAGNAGNAGNAGSRNATDPLTCTPTGTAGGSGLVHCAEGYEHRPSARACDANGAAQEPAPQALPRADGRPCDSPSACNAFAYGFCEMHASSGTSWRTCSSGCVTDDDCGTGAACTCGDPQSPTGGVCQPAQCRTDRDCGEQRLCLRYQESCGPGGFACQTPYDECESDADCSDHQRCVWELKPVGGGSNLAVSRRSCSNTVC